MIYAWKCIDCGVELDVQRPMADCLVSPEPFIDGERTCECDNDEGGKWQRVFTPPMMTKASYPDGVRKFTALREATQLQKESRKSKSKEHKKEIAAEIKKMGVRLSK